MKSRRLIVIATFAALLAAAGYGGYRAFLAPDASPAYKFATIESGPLTAAVSATGTLSPVVAVQVSSQISGQIREILVDFNSTVKAGQLIAQIAPETYEHKVRQAEADLEAARATVGGATGRDVSRQGQPRRCRTRFRAQANPGRQELSSRPPNSTR